MSAFYLSVLEFFLAFAVPFGCFLFCFRQYLSGNKKSNTLLFTLFYFIACFNPLLVFTSLFTTEIHHLWIFYVYFNTIFWGVHFLFLIYQILFIPTLNNIKSIVYLSGIFILLYMCTFIFIRGEIFYFHDYVIKRGISSAILSIFCLLYYFRFSKSNYDGSSHSIYYFWVIGSALSLSLPLLITSLILLYFGLKKINPLMESTYILIETICICTHFLLLLKAYRCQVK